MILGTTREVHLLEITLFQQKKPTPLLIFSNQINLLIISKVLLTPSVQKVMGATENLNNGSTLIK